ncbi:TPA: hypothetical protein R8306_001625, partial [Campylobacter jejuni]|nr:hypothetical protein [Campylobacter jejuni]EJJ5525472.1 hypothetical protein [Campylobacter jejuni]EKK5721700.1 hypothetical protein [Campylobacter coli]EKK7135465.1 hypothetical protein [Campylobacter jejuni]HEF2500369.1 hypothetical protein [Campylobacter jejuni]
MWIEWFKDSYKYIFDLHFSSVEKESRGSNLIQLKVSDKLKNELQKKADEVGVPLTTYIYHLLIERIEK